MTSPTIPSPDPVLPAVEASRETAAARPAHKSFLKSVGNVLRKSLHAGEAAALIAEPLVAAKVPDVAVIYGSAIQLAVNAEATVTTSTGSGTQKLSQVTASLVPQAQTWARTNGIEWHDTDITKWSSAVVDTLNMIPAPKPPSAA